MEEIVICPPFPPLMFQFITQTHGEEQVGNLDETLWDFKHVNLPIKINHLSFLDCSIDGVGRLEKTKQARRKLPEMDVVEKY